MILLLLKKCRTIATSRREGGTETENIAMIAAYIDYLVNLEENRSGQASDNRPISRWREFGLQKGVLRI